MVAVKPTGSDQVFVAQDRSGTDKAAFDRAMSGVFSVAQATGVGDSVRVNIFDLGIARPLPQDGASRLLRWSI